MSNNKQIIIALRYFPLQTFLHRIIWASRAARRNLHQNNTRTSQEWRGCSSLSLLEQLIQTLSCLSFRMNDFMFDDFLISWKTERSDISWIENEWIALTRTVRTITCQLREEMKIIFKRRSRRSVSIVQGSFRCQEEHRFVVLRCDLSGFQFQVEGKFQFTWQSQR